MNFKEKKVDFVIGGAQKSGTSALHAYLREHPDVFMPKGKEQHFFDFYWQKEGDDYNDYHKRFHAYKDERHVGEATPIYMFWPSSPQRIYNYNSKMKWIICLRNPIERAFSQWNMDHQKGKNPFSFLDTIQWDLNQMRLYPNFHHRKLSILKRGFYIYQIERLWKLFGKSNVHIIKYENFLNDQNMTLEGIYQFLDVPVFRIKGKKEILKIPYIEKIKDKEKAILKEVFYDEIENLEKILAWDCNDWKK